MIRGFKLVRSRIEGGEGVLILPCGGFWSSSPHQGRSCQQTVDTSGIARQGVQQDPP